MLGQVGREQVDGDAAVGPALAGVDHGGADPVAGLVQRGVGQTGEDHPGQPAGEVGLHLDQVTGGADQPHREDPRVPHLRTPLAGARRRRRRLGRARR